MEWKRVLLGKAFLSALALLVVLNGFFFFYQHGGSYGQFGVDAEAYHQQFQALSALSWEDGLARCIDSQEKYIADLFADLSRERPYTESAANRAMEQLQTQYEHLLSYEDYLTGIDRDAKKLQSVSLFSDPDNFAYKNTVKTAGDFQAMQGVPVTHGHDLAVTDVFEDRWADYSVLLLTLVVCALFLAERKAGLWPMVYAAPGGRVRLAVRRVAILLAAAVVGVLVVLLPRILLSGWLYHGLGEWDRALQSIPMFRNVPVPLTVGQFWLLYLAVKAAGTFLIGLALWAVMSAVANLGLALCAAGLLAGVEFACTAIPSSSAFAVLRYCNLFSYVDYVQVFVRYLNLPFAGGLISGSDLVLVILPPLCLVCAGLCLAIAGRKHPVAPVNRLLRVADRLRRRVDPLAARGRLLTLEAGKLLIQRKGLALIALLALVLTQAWPPGRKYDPLDMYDQFYEEKYVGPITGDTIAALEGELAIAQESERISALNRLIQRVSAAPEGAWLVPTGPYDAVWSQDTGSYHRSTALTALLFLALLLAPIASQENQAGVRPQLFASPAGRAWLWRRKASLAAILAAVVWAMVYGTELILIVRYYGSFRHLSAPISSLSLSLNMMTFFDWDLPISIGQTMALYYGLKLLVMVAAAQVCLLLSGLCRKNRDAILLCVGAVVIPAALVNIGSIALTMFSFLLPLACVEVFSMRLPFVCAAIVGAAAAGLSWHWQAGHRSLCQTAADKLKRLQELMSQLK